MEHRRNALVNLINEKGEVSFSAIKEAFPTVSDMTLRTDLKALDEDRRIIRIHGGAKSINAVVGKLDYLSDRFGRFTEEKKLIAQKAVGLLTEDAVCFLDSGSTTTELAKILPDQNNLIVTTGLTCATELARLTKPEVLVSGGKLNQHSMSVSGTSTVSYLKTINFDIAFLGVTCYSSELGFTSARVDDADLKRTAMQQSARVVLLMDSSKIGRKGHFAVSGLQDVDIIISDGNLPIAFLDECKASGVQVL